METDLKLSVLEVGDYQTNCYLLEKDGHVFVIDPGDGDQEVLKVLRRKDCVVDAVAVTHGHMDHFADAAGLAEYYDCPVYFPKDEVGYLSSSVSRRGPYRSTIFQNFEEILEKRGKLKTQGETLEWAHGNVSFELMMLAGHSDCGMCLYDKEHHWLFCGDQLFRTSVGRMDLYAGPKNLITEIKTKLMILPEETLVYPGHGPYTMIGFEAMRNPYLNGLFGFAE